MASTAETQDPDLALAAGTPDQPVDSGERIVTLDFIRGIAVLGILFPNIVAYAHPILAYYWPDGLPGGATRFDEATWLFQLVLIDGKFRGLFTMLFGAGMMLFIERVWARGGTRRLQARRLLWLGLFGLLHFYLLWTGDILFLYAVSGLIALSMLRWPARTQLRVGIAWYLGGALLLSLVLGGPAAIEGIPALQQRAPAQYEQIRKDSAEMVSDAAEESERMAGDSYGAIVSHRVTDEANMFGEVAFFAIAETVPLMLIGMALYRMGLFQRRFDPAKMRKWGWTGVIAGALLTIPLGWWTLARGFPQMLTQFTFSGVTAFLHLPMVLGLAALLSLWAPSATQTWLGRRFVAVGRMAFSNYLGTSTVMMLVFQGWAGDLWGLYHRDGLLLFVALGWLLMLTWSKLWLDRFRYGPLEWLWRCLTYWKVFPLRR
jgi:uncharacterized protein